MKTELKTVELSMRQCRANPGGEGVETVDKRTLHKYIYAFVAGDGNIHYPQKNKPHHKVQARMAISHTKDHEDYVLWKKEILENLTNVYLYEKEPVPPRKGLLTITTARHPIYTAVRERMYLSGRKTLDPHFLTYLDNEVLAIMYQDDGCLKVSEKERTVYFGTNAFTFAEQAMLAKAIHQKTGLHFTINKHMGNYRLRLSSKCFDDFFSCVGSHIMESFKDSKLPSPYVQPLDEGGDTVRTAQRCAELN
jgi:hypothetical protein